MNILLINQFFWPDQAATSQLLTDLARDLVRNGHTVTVICSKAQYAGAAPGSAPRVRVVRVPATRFVRGGLGRVLSYASFLATALYTGIRLGRVDVVLTLTTPPLLSVVGTVLKKLRGCRHLSWEMDMYPEVAVDCGYLQPDSLTVTVLGAISRYSRRQADGIIALGDCMRDRLIASGVPSQTIHVAENWADGKEIQPTPIEDDGVLTLLYSGNFGLAHDFDTLVEAVRTLRQDPRFEFLFSGAGARNEELKQIVAHEDLSNVQFLPYANREALGKALGRGDIGLVTQSNACSGSVVPSKVYGLMAAGRPILFIGPRSATPNRVIHRFDCGWQVDCGDSAGLITLLQRLATDPGEIRSAGERGRQAFLEHYDSSVGVARVSACLDVSPSASASKTAEVVRA